MHRRERSDGRAAALRELMWLCEAAGLEKPSAFTGTGADARQSARTTDAGSSSERMSFFPINCLSTWSSLGSTTTVAAIARHREW